MAVAKEQAESQFVRVWKYIAVRSTEERCYYTYEIGRAHV